MRIRTLLPLLGVLLSACSSDFDLFGKRSSTRTEGLGAPSSLSGQARGGGTEIVLQWTDNSTNETGFRVEVATKPMGPVQDVEEWTVVGANTTSHVHPSRPGFRYYLRVYAVTDTQQSSPSEQIDVATASGPPPAPAGLSAEGFSSSAIRLQWEEVGEESGYVVERAPGPGGPWELVTDVVAADTTTYVDGGLPPNTTYWYRVAASNALGMSGYSNEADGWTLAGGIGSTAFPTAEDDGYHTSVGVDGLGPYVAYYEPTFSRTMVRGPGPLRQIGGAEGSAGTSTAVSGGIAHVATIAPNMLLRSSGSSSGGFATVGVNLANGWSARPKLIAGGAGREYVGVSSTAGASLLYWLEGAGGNYIVTGHGAVHGLAFARDLAGHLHVAYTATGPGGGTPGLFYAFKSAGGVNWNVAALPSIGRPTDVSIVTERTGTGPTPFADIPHVIYHDSLSGGLHHVWRPNLLVGTGYQTEVIEAPADRHVGAYNGMVLASGTLHIVYYDATRGDLRHAKRLPDGSWRLSTLDAVGDVGSHASIAASGAQIYVAYRDATNGDLKLASGAP